MSVKPYVNTNPSVTNVASKYMDGSWCADAVPPVNNMGGINLTGTQFDNDGKIIGIPVYRDKGDLVKNPDSNLSGAAFIDWLNFTFKIDFFYKKYPLSNAVSDDGDDIVACVSVELSRILGFGVTSNLGYGKNFYKNSYVIGDGWGFLYIGGKSQNNTCLIMVNGQGCMASRPSSPRLIHDFIEEVEGKITQIHLSADFFEGEYNIDKAVKDYEDGLFRIRGTMPKSRVAGDWLNRDTDEDGLTLYLGKKENGKECCIYEKGKQLGGSYAKDYRDWVRVELRYLSKDRVIPLDVLLNPGQYLAAGYPALSFISEKQSKIKTAKAKTKVVYEKAKEVLKQQFGGLLYVMFSMGEDFSDVVRDVVPPRLISPDFEVRQLEDMDFGGMSHEIALSLAFT